MFVSIYIAVWLHREEDYGNSTNTEGAEAHLLQFSTKVCKMNRKENTSGVHHEEEEKEIRHHKINIYIYM